MATIYPGNIPSLEQLKVGDKIRFSGKLTEQDPNIQKLFGQNAATWDVDPTTNKNIGITVQKPYVLPGTSYLPGVSPSDSNYWSINPDRLTPGDTSGDTTQNLGGLGSGGFYGSQAYNDLLKLINGPDVATPDYNAATDPAQQAAESQYLYDTGTISQKYNNARSNVYDVGNRNTGTLKRLLGRAGGFTTTAGAQAMVGQQGDIDAQINQLNIAQEQALAAAKTAMLTGKAKIAKDAIDNLVSIQEKQDEARQAKATQLLSLLNLQETSRRNDLTSSLNADKQQLAEDKQAFTEEQANLKQQNALELKGWQYVSTPAERDSLIASGRTIKDINGRLYVAPTTTKTVKGKLVTIDSINGNVIGSSPIAGGGVTGTTGTSGLPKTEITKINTLIDTELKNLSKGGDWGTSWNYIRNLFPQSEYPALTNEDIDAYLRKDQFYPKETAAVETSNPVVDWFRKNWDLRKQ